MAGIVAWMHGKKSSSLGKLRGKEREEGFRVLLFLGVFLGLIVALVLIGPPTLKGKAIAVRECVDHVDNDDDGKIDLADSGCENAKDDQEADCGDGVCNSVEGPVSCSVDCGLDTCSDTDKGYYTNVRGAIKGVYHKKAFLQEDYCKDSKTLVEYSCGTGAPKGVAVSCANAVTSRCDEGTCV